ncbi:MAG TPA: 3-deoxy-manno-octulosonate cytidylyltransferase [Steroidobacteraceae bacterium]|nr:3-deoxy-manno-octulosonate cytidylyltransferase [Steroidobacteraceae bacterium]
MRRDVFRVVIPARYASSRLPGKVLLSMGGKPMLQWVYERARASGAQEVLIATDDLLVVGAAHSFGADTVMTSAQHTSGTDRIAEVARRRGWLDTDIVVNVQGDEPLLPPSLIDQVAMALRDDSEAGIATLATPVESLAELLDPNAVKVVAAADGRALYFSRAPIPWNRDEAPAGLASQSSFAGTRRHVGIYAYRVGALLRLSALQPGVLERREKLEQLRALENGIGIRVLDAAERPGPDVNTPADLERVGALLRR